MDNEDRIKRWRQQREARGAAPAGLTDDDEDDLVGLNPPKRARAERAERTERAEAADIDTLPHEISLAEARAAIRARRRARWRLILRRAFLFLGVPLLAILAYMWLVATPLYQGEAVFTVQTSSESAPASTSGLFGLGAGSTAISDAFKAREFILSRPMMAYMEKRHGYMSHFASSEMDPLQRLRSPIGTNRDPFDYYQERVRVSVDVQEGILRLYVQARTPEDAVRFGNAILGAAEQHVNEFSEKISSDQIDALTRDVQNAERQVADTRRGLAMVQARRGDLSPEQTATAVYSLISQLQLQLAEAERERNALLDQGLTNSPLLPRLTSRVQELQSQIAEQRGRLANPGGGSLARSVNEFESASAKKEIAETRWETTLKTLQSAYLRILEQRRYFVLVVDMAVGNFPKVRDIMSIAWPILLLLALLYALVWSARRARAGGAGFDTYRFREVIGQWRRR